MKFFDYAITFREMPFNPSGSLTFFTGGQCKYGCNGCSWGEVKPEGVEMSIEEFKSILQKKKKHTQAVCFLGEGYEGDLINYLAAAREEGFLTMLYTGGSIEDFNPDTLNLLDYIKVGRWKGKTLYEEGTNQKVYRLEKGNIKEEVKFYEL